MCFCAEASFAASAVLLPAGVYCTSVAVRHRPAYLPLAIIPLVFSFQQFAEGLVWLGLAGENSALATVAALSFLAVALVFWPIWIPLSVLFLEARPARKRWLAALAFLGLIYGCAVYLPLAWDPERWLKVAVLHHSIGYNLKSLPTFDIVSRAYCDACYAVIVLAPFLIARLDERFTVFFLLLAGSAVLSFFAFSYALVSIWCFFAAILSLQLCFGFRRMRLEQAQIISITR